MDLYYTDWPLSQGYLKIWIYNHHDVWRFGFISLPNLEELAVLLTLLHIFFFRLSKYSHRYCLIFKNDLANYLTDKIVIVLNWLCFLIKFLSLDENISGSVLAILKVICKSNQSYFLSLHKQFSKFLCYEIVWNFVIYHKEEVGIYSRHIQALINIYASKLIHVPERSQ